MSRQGCVHSRAAASVRVGTVPAQARFVVTSLLASLKSLLNSQKLGVLSSVQRAEELEPRPGRPVAVGHLVLQLGRGAERGCGQGDAHGLGLHECPLAGQTARVGVQSPGDRLHLRTGRRRGDGEAFGNPLRVANAGARERGDALAFGEMSPALRAWETHRAVSRREGEKSPVLGSSVSRTPPS